MNLATIGIKILYIILSYAAVSGSYSISKWYVTDYRLKKINKADWFEKGFNCLGGVVIAFIVAGFAGSIGNKNLHVNEPLAIAAFIVISISSCTGMLNAYKKDNELTPQQKRIRKLLAETQQKEIEERGGYSEM